MVVNEKALIASLARQYHVDPRAALAIASVEGGFHGAVGDMGTSFGPFQLHEGGALPHGRGAAWANSRAGIEYAIKHIASVAAGLHGRQAVAAISSRFERPANVPAEIAKAMSRYGGKVPSGGFPIKGYFMGGGGAGHQEVVAQLIQQMLSSAPRRQYTQPIVQPIQRALGGTYYGFDS